jgi:hypothetical protein
LTYKPKKTKTIGFYYMKNEKEKEMRSEEKVKEENGNK